MILELVEEVLAFVDEELDDVALELVEEALEIVDELLDDVALELVDTVLDVDVELPEVDDDAGSVGVLLLTVPVGGIPLAGGVQLLPAHTIP